MAFFVLPLDAERAVEVVTRVALVQRVQHHPPVERGGAVEVDVVLLGAADNAHHFFAEADKVDGSHRGHADGVREPFNVLEAALVAVHQVLDYLEPVGFLFAASLFHLTAQFSCRRGFRFQPFGDGLPVCRDVDLGHHELSELGRRGPQELFVVSAFPVDEALLLPGSTQRAVELVKGLQRGLLQEHTVLLSLPDGFARPVAGAHDELLRVRDARELLDEHPVHVDEVHRRALVLKAESGQFRHERPVVRDLRVFGTIGVAGNVWQVR